jgi:hypothetical protein
MAHVTPFVGSMCFKQPPENGITRVDQQFVIHVYPNGF